VVSLEEVAADLVVVPLHCAEHADGVQSREGQQKKETAEAGE